jgi:transposase
VLIPSCIQTCSNRKLDEMRLPRPIPESALEELAVLLKQCQDKATYQRVQGVWLRAAIGLSAPQIAQALGWSLSAVHHVPARYLRQGSVALLGPGRGGRAHAHLSVAEEQQLLTRFAASAAHGGVVEASPVRHAYEAAIGRTVPKSTVYRLLSRHGWRKLAPRPRHRAASAATQEAFKKSSVACYVPRCSARSNRAAPCG